MSDEPYYWQPAEFDPEQWKRDQAATPISEPYSPVNGHASHVGSHVNGHTPRVPSWAKAPEIDLASLDGADPNLAAPVPPMAIPGLVGELVRQAWDSSTWQIAEVAIASALSSMSLLCSRTYRHGTLGMSLYLMVIAPTSTGKGFGYRANNAWHKALVNALKPKLPMGDIHAANLEMMIINEVGSSQGLLQLFQKVPTVLMQSDEFVPKLSLMAQLNPPPHMAALRDDLLRLVDNSGVNAVLRGKPYSNRPANAPPAEKNIIMASLSILAAGTPEEFYTQLTPQLLTSGFLPRFTILEYEGGLARKNLFPKTKIDKELLAKLMLLFVNCQDRAKEIDGESLAPIIDVQGDKQGEAALQWFENVCLNKMTAAQSAGLPTTGLWSRAKEHVRQIASLIAIGVDSANPVITKEHVEIAIAIARPMVDKLCAKVTNSEVGEGDNRIIGEIRKVMAQLFAGGYERYGKAQPMLRADLLDAGYIQVSVVKNICSKKASFINHKLGSNRAFDEGIKAMETYGDIERHTVPNSRAIIVKLNEDVFRPIVAEVIAANNKQKPN